uniref:DUF753 domain-containing protein n=1 Tax=Anopheles farauti TaxID=69004 RepID=A0A182QEL6_9DIPT
MRPDRVLVGPSKADSNLLPTFQLSSNPGYSENENGRRGCTSDPEYEIDCPAGGAGGSLCSQCDPVDGGKLCNDIQRCSVCDSGTSPDCALDASFVRRCPKVSDQCYRYVNELQVLQLGCTSAEDYLINCQEPSNCHTCAGDGCNGGEAKFRCHTCDDCYSVDPTLNDKLECNRAETDQCYTGYVWSTKRTYRGCQKEDLPQFDAFEVCDDDSCNGRDFPAHLQCYQCVGCDTFSDENVNYCRSVDATGCFMLLTEFEQGVKTIVRGCNTDAAYGDCQEDRNCVTCAGDLCNNSPRTAVRLCSSCTGAEECERQTSAPSCLDTVFTNQCYLYSDGDGELQKGCLLDLDPTSPMVEACYDPNDARCSLCKDFNCNRQHCVRCDTRTDGLACVLASKEKPLRYTLCSGACRVEIDAEGHTVRGCASDFTEPCAAAAAAAAAGADTCVETSAPGSNADVFPPTRLLCFQCAGESCLAEQETADGQFCQLYGGASDGCYIYNDGSEVVRGCTTDRQAKCTDNANPSCTVRTDSLSNGAAQELRAQAITCYETCSGSGSEQIPSCPPITCPPETDRCYVSVSNDGFIYRGCTSASIGCPPDTRDCFVCREPNCNGVYAVCSKCDTAIDGDCSTAEEHGKICAQSSGCFQYQDENGASYGCASEAPPLCEEDKEHCQLCEGAFCNKKVLNSCFSCTNCPDVLRPLQPTKVCASEGDRCVTGVVGESIVRDCLLEMPADYFPVEECGGWNCNTFLVGDWVRCYECTDCPDAPGVDDSTYCINPTASECYTKLEEGRVSRGCATEAGIENCDEGVNCAVCDQTDCNGLAIPTEFSCVRCSGGIDCADYNVLSQCPLELPLLFEGCVTYTDGASVTKGCLSEVSLFMNCAAGLNEEKCSVIMRPKGNARPVRCLECTDGVDCVEGDASVLPARTVEHGSCVTLVNANGLVERGNMLDYPDGCRGASECTECFTDLCNEGLFPPQRLLCYQCSGADCAQLPLTPSVEPRPCLLHDPANAQCYTWYDNASSARRGCLLDDTVCQTPGVSCNSCTESACNDLDYGAFVSTETCVQCATNEACENEQAVENCSGPGGCYTFTVGSFVIAKGCLSELESSMTWYESCTSGTPSDGCRLCVGNNCNRNRCFVCNSRLDGGANCVDARIGITDAVACPDSDVCVAFIDGNVLRCPFTSHPRPVSLASFSVFAADGYTVRGCGDTFVDQLAGCAEAGETCQQCRGDHCNGQPVPGDRIRCFQCSGSSDECLTPAKGNDSYCEIYREGKETCFTHFIDETTVERGCTLQRDEPCEGSCQQCATTGCNDQRPFATNPLRCVQCAGDECSDAGSEAQQCADEILFGYADRCYTYFHPDGTIDRGCVSGLKKSGNPALAEQCLDARDESCKACSPVGCNARSVDCFVCDSLTHPDCGGALGEATAESLIRTCGTGQCVSLVEETATRKGCAEDFEEQCGMAPGALCAVFDGPLSNGDTYPADRFQCVQCRGVGCDTIQPANSLATVCKVYVPDDECYTYVADDGETFRGCLSDEDADQCKEHPEHCVRCSSQSGCNIEPSRTTNELVCVQCSGSTECKQPTRYDSCTKSVLLGRHDACYVYSFNGEILARGCLSDVEEERVVVACTSGSSGSDCRVCQCDRCNGPPVECVQCESATGCGGVFGNAANVAQCLTGACVSFVQQSAVAGTSLIVKGCSEEHEREVCVKKPDNPADYELCHASKCNDVPFPAGRLKCYQCAGESCTDSSLVPTICEPYRGAGEKCYTFLDRLQKGCVGQLEDPEQCADGAGACLVCDSSDGCNDEPRALECTVCSSANDRSCVDPMSPAKKKTVCPIGGCVTFIDRDGYTVKGCANDHELTEEICSSGEANCFVCTDADSCNDVLYPPARLQCHQCAGPGCVDVASQKPTICPRYVLDDSCYSYASSATNIERGCLSDRATACPDECVTCASEDGCNADHPIVNNLLTCHRCDGPDCAPAPAEQGSECPAAVLLGRSDACYSYVEKYGVRRGCMSEERACDPTDPNCHVCSSGNDCNGDAYSVDVRECIQCDEGEDGEACKWGFDRTRSTKRCPEQSFYDGGCYTCYTSAALAATTPKRPLFHRGCTGDERQARCETDTVQVCLGAGCNHRNERLQICAKCDGDCENGRWLVEECRGTVEYERRGCYLIRDARKNVQARGCVADLDEAELVAIAIGHVTGPFITISARLCLILMKRRLNSNPQPFDSRKSHSILPSISTMFALNVSCSFRRSIVEIVMTPSSFDFQLYPSFSSAVDRRLSVSSHRVETKKRVIRRTNRWNGFCCCCCWVPTLCVGFSCVQRIRSSSMVGCEKQNPFRASIASSTPFTSVCTITGTGCD